MSKSNGIKKFLDRAIEKGFSTLVDWIIGHGDKPRTLAEILEYYSMNLNDSGRFGRMAEVMLRYELTRKVHRAHPQNASDIRFNGKCIEVKTNCGWLTDTSFPTEEHAALYWEQTYKPIKRADFIAYCPQFDGTNLNDFAFFKQRDFINLLDEFNLLTVKKASPASGGAYGVAIQSYIPTAKFKASKERYNAFIGELYYRGMNIDDFIATYGTEIDPNA